MNMHTLNIWAIVVAAVAAFLLGGLWYSPLLFVKPWKRANGFPEEPGAPGNMALIFGLSLLFTLVMSFNLAKNFDVVAENSATLLGSNFSAAVWFNVSSGNSGPLLGFGSSPNDTAESTSDYPVMWIDGSYDMVRFQEMAKYGRSSGVDFGPIDVVKFAEALLVAKPALLQLRAKEEPAREVLALLRAIAPLCHRAHVPLVANDRADLASFASHERNWKHREHRGKQERRHHVRMHPTEQPHSPHDRPRDGDRRPDRANHLPQPALCRCPARPAVQW